MRDLKEDAKSLFLDAVRAVRPDGLLERMRLEDLVSRPFTSYDRIVVVGMGKAAMAMASAVECQLDGHITEGCVVVPRGYPAAWPVELPRPAATKVRESGHPVSDHASAAAAQEILRIASAAGKDDLVIVLISGGGSALCADYLGGITSDQVGEVFRLLTRAGADIHELNAVRKHLSRIAGGRLAAAAHPAETVSLIISDVVGDDLSTIASGPTVGDRTSAEDALGVLTRAGVRDDVPRRVIEFLEEVRGNPDLETIRPESPVFERVRNRIIATNATALDVLAQRASNSGYEVVRMERPITGEARDAGRRLAEQALGIGPESAVCILSGGETTVTVQGNGRGGRNQELALAAAIMLDGTDEVALLSGGTDGIDGPTDAAGAVIDGATLADARKAGLEAFSFLTSNDSYAFFRAVGGHVITGPTHTNVMDVQILLKGAR